MLVSIGVTLPPIIKTRRCRQQGAEADGSSHNKRHRFQQQQNIGNDKTPTMTTFTTRRQSLDANNNDDIPITTTTIGRQR